MSEEKNPAGAKRVRGRPITKENAAQYQLSSNQAKARRKQARLNMLNKLTTELDLGAEMVKAFKAHDEKQMELIERALKMVGLHHEQTDEARAQHLNVKSEVNAKTDNTLHVTIEEV